MQSLEEWRLKGGCRFYHSSEDGYLLYEIVITELEYGQPIESAIGDLYFTGWRKNEENGTNWHFVRELLMENSTVQDLVDFACERDASVISIKRKESNEISKRT